MDAHTLVLQVLFVLQSHWHQRVLLHLVVLFDHFLVHLVCLEGLFHQVCQFAQELLADQLHQLLQLAQVLRVLLEFHLDLELLFVQVSLLVLLFLHRLGYQ